MPKENFPASMNMDTFVIEESGLQEGDNPMLDARGEENQANRESQVPVDGPITPKHICATRIEWATPPLGEEKDSEGVPLRFRTIHNLEQTTEPLNLEYSGLCLFNAKEPVNVEATLRKEC